MAMTEDLSVFFDVAEFADAATLNGVSVMGIFDAAYLQEEFGGSASTPAFTLASASVPAPVVGLLLVVNGVTYKVVEPMPDGTGITILRLRT
jgi:hypothetical protein